MSRDWEEQFRQWAKPPGKTEQDKCANAENAIKKAIAQSQTLTRRDIYFTVGYRLIESKAKDWGLFGPS